MNKLVLFFILSITACTLYAEQPLVKFYLSDGSTKQYNIEDIVNLCFITSNLSYQMQIFSKDSGSKTEYDTRIIDSISFENNDKMFINLSCKIIEKNLWEIDSIIFVLNTCKEIQIGNQIWMCKNLDVDHYRNGDPIPHVSDKEEWKKLRSGAWCYYNNDSSIGAIYGKLYNWYAVNDPRGLAPECWHIPTDDEWTELENFLGGSDIAGGKLKETGSNHWNNNAGATNETGFTALPGGYRSGIGDFYHNRAFGYWWSSTQIYGTHAWFRILYFGNAIVNRMDYWWENGMSVRCLKD